MSKAKQILKQYWGFEQFRDPQEAIINDVLAGKDVVALLPTGSGKSVCFQVPTLVQKNGICIVVSPLIALMNDQVTSLKEKGIKAIALTGSIRQDDIVRHFDNLQHGDTRFLYISPERLQNPFIQEKIKQLAVSLIAIDEAHCISEWGHDFRPSYLKISMLRELHPDVPILALTATATRRVVKDIYSFLEMPKPVLHKKSLQRENISLKVIESADKLGVLLGLVQNVKGSVIVYAASRRKCQQLSEYLVNQGVHATFYHAGLTKEQKSKAFTEWMSEAKNVIVATNAFGMGIDKANVRKVIHVNVPSSLENYIQEIGRAGRDGLKSEAVLIEEIADLKSTESFYLKALPGIDFVRKTYNNLNQFLKITYGELPTQIYDFDLAAFCYTYTMPLVKTHNAIQVLEREEILVFVHDSRKATQVKFTSSGEKLFDYYRKNQNKEKILKVLLRTYEGIMYDFQNINLYRVSKSTGFNLFQTEKQLREAATDGVIHFIKKENKSTLYFIKPREDNYTINTIAKNIKKQQENKIEKYANMLAYITNDTICRNQKITTYFGEETAPCGICDICESKEILNIDYSKLNTTILRKLSEKALTSKELVKALNVSDRVVLNAIRNLLDSNIIMLNSQNKYHL